MLQIKLLKVYEVDKIGFTLTNYNIKSAIYLIHLFILQIKIIDATYQQIQSDILLYIYLHNSIYRNDQQQH